MDTVHETEREKPVHQRVNSSMQARKSSKVLDYVLNDTEARIRNDSEGPASLRVGNLISVAFSAKNRENADTSTFKVLPLRVKGKNSIRIKTDFSRKKHR